MAHGFSAFRVTAFRLQQGVGYRGEESCGRPKLYPQGQETKENEEVAKVPPSPLGVILSDIKASP